MREEVNQRGRRDAELSHSDDSFVVRTMRIRWQKLAATKEIFVQKMERVSLLAEIENEPISCQK